ncbi:MAG: Ig-like domain-containing protein [Thauera sp.]|nr:Ig-like domain-containing protein [Thauera sp.]
MRSFMESALLKGLTLAGAAVAVASCGGGGGGGGGNNAVGLPGSGVNPVNAYSLSLTSSVTQLPLNVLGSPAGIGVNAPYTTTLYVTGTRAGTRDSVPDGTSFACNVVPDGLEYGSLYYLDGDDAHEDDDGNALSYRAIALESSAGGASFHFHAGARAGIATITCAVTDPQSTKQVVATRQIAVGQSSGVSAQALIAAAAPGFVYAQNAGGPSALQVQARILDDAGQPVPDPAAGVSNVIARIVSTAGAADDFALLSAGGQLGKTVTLATIGGIAQFSLVSGAQTGSVLVEVVADRADNNVGNGITTQVGNALSIAVVDGSSSGDELAITSNGTLPGASVGQSYATILSASGGVAPYTWSLSSGSSLPGGLTLASDGIISGVPASGGTFRFIVRVRDSASSAASKLQEASITVAGGATGALTISASELPPKGSVGVYYAFAPNLTGGASPYAWSATTLPAGLAIDSRTGFITGTPSVSGKFTVVLTVADANGAQALRNLSLEIDGPSGGGVAVDNTAPTVLFTIPTSDLTGVDRCSDVIVRFDEAIDPITVNNVTMTVERVGGETFSMGTAAKLDDRTFTLKQLPGNCYSAGANYRLVLTDSIRDLSGNPLAQVVVPFSTGGQVDDVPPRTSYTIPPSNTVVDRCSDVIVRFNEAIDPVTVNNVSMFVRKVGGLIFSMGGTSQLDDRTFMLNQGGACYDAASNYELVLSSSIRDLAENPMVQEVVPFSTGGQVDNVPPRVAYTIPSSGAIVDRCSDIVVRFNEAIDPVTVNNVSMFVRRVGGSNFSMGGTSQIDDRTFTLNQGLSCYDQGTNYELVMTNSIRDLAQNAFVQDVVPFSTGGQVDTVAPQVAYTIPANGAVDVSPTGNVTVVFNEAIDTDTIQPQSFAVYEIDDFKGVIIDVLPTDTSLLAETDRRFTLGPDDPGSLWSFSIGRYYRVVMSTSPRDLAGNTIESLDPQPDNQPDDAPVSLIFEFRVGNLPN